MCLEALESKRSVGKHLGKRGKREFQSEISNGRICKNEGGKAPTDLKLEIN